MGKVFWGSVAVTDIEFNQVLLWLRGRSLAELLMILQTVVDLLQGQILGTLPIEDLDATPTPERIQDVIDDTLLFRGWTIGTLAKQIDMMLPRLMQISEGDRPSAEELEKLRCALVRLSDGDWSLEELEMIVAQQYGDAAPEAPTPTTIADVIIGNWDALVAQGKIPLERLQALRDGKKPTEAEILRLVQLGISEDRLTEMAAHCEENGNGHTTEHHNASPTPP